MKKIPKVINLAYLELLVREQEKKEEQINNKITFAIDSNRDE
jgi:hypothetical protein